MLIFFLALAGIWVARIMFVRWLKKKFPPPHPQQQNKKDQIDVLVPCKQCGTFVPKNQATKEEEGYYCKDHTKRDTIDR
jgi:hypothetical protein